MKVAITINDVLRVFYSNFIEIYEIYNEEEENDVGVTFFANDENASFDENIPLEFNEIISTKKEKILLNLDGILDPMYLTKKFEFENYTDYYEFFYSKLAFEIFAKTILTYQDVFADLEQLFLFFQRKGIQVDLVSLENNNSRPATLFFLAREKCRIDSIKFLNHYQNMWQDYEIIITADNYLIENKPKRRKCFAIKSECNIDLQQQESKIFYTNLKEILTYFINEQQ